MLSEESFYNWMAFIGAYAYLFMLLIHQVRGRFGTEAAARVVCGEGTGFRPGVAESCPREHEVHGFMLVFLYAQ